MRRMILLGVVMMAAIVAFFVMSRRTIGNADWTFDFGVDPGELVSSGQNPFFILEPGYVLVLEDSTTRLTITVLHETRRIDGVETRVVEERETENDVVIEVSRNFFAISQRTNSVFYFGEEVDNYEGGRIVNHDGAWQSGSGEARFGLAMPGLPLLRARYYQEIAPGVAMDRAEIVSITDSISGPAGAMRDLLRTAESSPLEPGVTEHKYYARGIGLVRDGSLTLVSNGLALPRDTVRVTGSVR
jgi:hypothetical protein